MFNRDVFFGELTEGDSMDPLHREIANTIFDEWEANRPFDARWLAYIMATALDDHGRCDTPDIETGCDNLITGMIEGWYTGRRLSEYFTPEFGAWLPARAIVDPDLGDAESVAADAKDIYRALNAASDTALPPVPVELSELPVPPDPEPPAPEPEPEV